MKAIPKLHRARMHWLETLAVRTFAAQLRPKWTALQVFRGMSRYSKGDAMSNLSVANNDRDDNASPLTPHRPPPPKPTDVVQRIGIAAASHEITDADMIGDALQMLAERNQPVTIYPAGAEQAVLCRIHSVHPEEPHFTLELYDGTTLPAGRCTFVTWLDAARFQFELTANWKALPGQPALVPADFPEHCLVLNRRSNTRLETPLTGNYTASFVLFGSPFELQLYDISAGGIGMRCAPREASGLHIGRKLQRVRLELNDTVIICDLEIRLSRRFRSFLLGEQVQIGCRFVNLTPQMQAELDRAIGSMALGRR